MNWLAFNFGLFIGLNYLDYLTTKLAVVLGGEEWNPLISMVLEYQGFTGLLIIKAIMILLILFLVILKSAWHESINRIFYVVNPIIACVIAGNVLNIYLLITSYG